MTLPITVQHDPARQRFSAVLPDGSEAALTYERRGDRLDFTHTDVPEAYRTQGVAEQVVVAGFTYAQQQRCRVIPSCPYISRGFLRRHPEFQTLTD